MFENAKANIKKFVESPKTKQFVHDVAVGTAVMVISMVAGAAISAGIAAVSEKIEAGKTEDEQTVETVEEIA